MKNLGSSFENKEALKIANRVLKSLNQKLKEESINWNIPVLQIMMNVERAKLEQLKDGSYEITGFHSIAKRRDSLNDHNVTLWYNYTSTQKQLKQMIYNCIMRDIEAKDRNDENIKFY